MPVMDNSPIWKSDFARPNTLNVSIVADTGKEMAVYEEKRVESLLYGDFDELK